MWARIGQVTIALAPLPFAWWVVVHLGMRHPLTLHQFMGERGLFERLQNALLGSSFLLSSGLAIAAQRRRLFLHACLFALFAFGTAVIGMEEISWGQKWFGYATPDAIERSSVQAEMNFHNIAGLHEKQGYVVAAICIAAILSSIVRFAPHIRRHPMSCFLTAPPQTILWFGIAAAYVLKGAALRPLFVAPFSSRIVSYLQEPAECLFYGGFLLITLSWLRRWIEMRQDSAAQPTEQTG